MDEYIFICYDNEGKIKAVLPKDLKPDEIGIRCISIKKVIIDSMSN